MLLPIPVGVEAEVRTLPRAAIAILVLNCIVFLLTRGDTRALEKAEARLERLASWEVEKAGAQYPELGARAQGHHRALDFLASDATWEQLVGDESSRDRLRGYVAEYRELTTRHAFYRYGFVPANVTFVRLLAHPFLHADILHLFFNLLFLWVVAGVLEDRIGAGRFLGLYFASAFAAAAAHWAWRPSSGEPAIGASGAVAGLMGAFTVWFAATRIHIVLVYALGLVPRLKPLAIPAWLFLGLWLLQQLFWATLTHRSSVGVAFWAHVGGFACGVVGALAFNMIGALSGFQRSANRGATAPRPGSRRPRSSS